MTEQRPVDDDVPRGLKIGAAYGWRILILVAVAAVFVWGIMQVPLLVIPMLVALLMTALLWPGMAWLMRHKVPQWLATIITLLFTGAIVTFLIWLIANQVRAEWPSVQEKSVVAWEGYVEFFTKIANDFGINADQFNSWLDQGLKFLDENSQRLLNTGVALGWTVGHFVTGAILSLFILIVFLADGGSVWRWTLNLFPKKSQPAVKAAGENGWNTVVNYARTQLLVATIDGVGIAIGAAILQVPLAVPIGVLVFLGAFVPIVGALVTGAFAVLLALVYNGWLSALLMLLVVLLVQQVEGHILQPLLMGHAVKVHPLAIVLVVTGGTMIAGIPGALFAVPIAAFVNVAWLTISSGSWKTGEPVNPEQTLWYTVESQSRDGSANGDGTPRTKSLTRKPRAKKAAAIKRTPRRTTKRSTRKNTASDTDTAAD